MWRKLLEFILKLKWALAPLMCYWNISLYLAPFLFPGSSRWCSWIIRDLSPNSLYWFQGSSCWLSCWYILGGHVCYSFQEEIWRVSKLLILHYHKALMVTAIFQITCAHPFCQYQINISCFCFFLSFNYWT